jgi:uncharacterized membrane protein
MFPCSDFCYGYWLIFPIIMTGIMVLCFFMMRGHKGSMMCGPCSRGKDTHAEELRESALNERYVRGEVDNHESEEKNKTIST